MNRAFLSHSSKQKDLVKRIASNLGKAQCIYDDYEFESGLPISDEIIKGLEKSDLFVLFLSNEALDSKWVKDEILIAESKFTDSKRFFPVLIDSNISISTDMRIPDWLKNYLLKPFTDPFIITKKIKQKIREISLEENPIFRAKEELFVGRNEEFDSFESKIYSLEDIKPNSIIISGFDGIGRRTFLTNALKRSNKIENSYQPIYIDLGGKDSIEDFILKLQDIENSNTDEYLQYLSQLSYDEKISEALKLLDKIQDSNEYIYIIDTGCVIQPTKRVADWYVELITNQKHNGIITLNVISKFRPSNEFLRNYKKVFHVHLSNLSDKDTEKLFVKYSSLLKLDLVQEDAKNILQVLNGIPSQVHFTVEYIKDYGITETVKNLDNIIDYGETQVYYLIDLVKSKGEEAYELLILLSNFEFVSYDFLFTVTGDEKKIKDLLEEFYILGVFDLVGANKEYIKIHYPIKDYLSRLKAKISHRHSVRLKDSIKTFINTLGNKNDYNDISELLYSVKGAILQGIKLPSQYYIPSFVLKTIVDLYYKGNHQSVISLVDKVLENTKNLDLTIIREFNYWLCLSLAKTKNSRFEIEVEKLEGIDYDYLYGFYYRFKRDFDRAQKHLQFAVNKSPNFQRAKRELVNILLLKEDFENALITAKENYENQKLNAFHIQAYFLCLIRKKFLLKEDRVVIQELFKNIDRSYDSRSKEIANVMSGESAFYIEANTVKAIGILRDCIKTNISKHFPLKSLLNIYEKTGMSAAANELRYSYNNRDLSYLE